MEKAEKIQQLLRQKAECVAQLNLLPYDGTPEIKENSSGKYIYIRKRVAGKLTSGYVDKFSEELYQTLIAYSKKARELKKCIRKIEKQLADFGHTTTALASNVILNLDFARANMKTSIYDQAILEGVATTFPQTETIIDNGKVYGMTATDIQKILNLKRAWEFVLDEDVLSITSNYHILCCIAKLVNEGFYHDGGKIRSTTVKIGGANYVPPIPFEADVKENIENITSSSKPKIDVAIELCLYCMKTQIFNDGNKRTSVIFANHYLIQNAQGLLVISQDKVSQFKKLLVEYYETAQPTKIAKFLKDYCWQQF